MTNDESNTMDALFARVRELTADGFDHLKAWGTADLERRIEAWPEAWNDDLQILIYGDFRPPEGVVTVPHLGITVYPENQTSTIIESALCVLKANVTVSNKNISSLIDATRRINLFLGIYMLVSLGNVGCGWWSEITHEVGLSAGYSPRLDDEALLPAIESACKFPGKVRRKIEAALYWIREPRNMLREFYRPDLLRVFSGYWNAFECLVDAVNALRPQPKQSRSEKQQAIDSFIGAKSGKLTSGDIVKCYQQIVSPGFVGKATHAFNVCFPEHATLYVDECFEMNPREDRLYDIRNAINHGDIDAENTTELLRVESRLHRLWMIVWRMAGRLVAFPAPMEHDNTKENVS